MSEVEEIPCSHWGSLEDGDRQLNRVDKPEVCEPLTSVIGPAIKGGGRAYAGSTRQGDREESLRERKWVSTILNRRTGVIWERGRFSVVVTWVRHWQRTFSDFPFVSIYLALLEKLP